MKSSLRSLQALPFGTISRHPDVVLTLFVGAVISMMILPIPAALLDTMLALNIAAAGVILVAVLLSEKPLSISTFPTLLLITTLFRLALNVSTTRMILSKGTAGEVVQAFGHFVVQGDLVVGVVIFLVITLVQFLVIGKGAERVAEVGARFTLDAMPGKQMSIDAAVRSGSLDEEEAQAKRDELGRESQFYGAMDGAMKFIKGDAIAGLIITALNVVAGLIIGVARNGMAATDAAEVYSILTVGDGLVSQIPALLITLSAGVLTTRVASKEPKASLGGNLKSELLASPKVLALGATFSFGLGIIPGLPVLPFFVIGAGLALAAYLGVRGESKAVGRAEAKESFEAKLDKKVKLAQAQRAQVDNMAPTVTAIGIDLDPVLSRALGFTPGADDRETKLIGELMPQLRDGIYGRSGVRIPGTFVRTNVPGLLPGTCVIKLKNVPLRTVQLDPTKVMAFESVAKLRRLGVESTPTMSPAGAEVAYVDKDKAAALEAASVTVHDVTDVVTLHLFNVVNQNLKLFVGVQETSELVERLGKVYPALVREVVPKTVTIVQLTDILRRLVDEGISICDLKSILEALAEFGASEQDGVVLTELVRAALSMQLAHMFVGPDRQLSVALLDPVIEDTILGAIRHTTNGSFVALEPEILRAFILQAARATDVLVREGKRPLILTTAEIRRYVRKLIEQHLPNVAVLSFQELPTDVTVQALGRIGIPDELPAAA